MSVVLGDITYQLIGTNKHLRWTTSLILMPGATRAPSTLHQLFACNILKSSRIPSEGLMHGSKASESESVTCESQFSAHHSSSCQSLLFANIYSMLAETLDTLYSIGNNLYWFMFLTKMFLRMKRENIIKKFKYNAKTIAKQLSMCFPNMGQKYCQGEMTLSENLSRETVHHGRPILLEFISTAKDWTQYGRRTCYKLEGNAGPII